MQNKKALILGLILIFSLTAILYAFYKTPDENVYEGPVESLSVAAYEGEFSALIFIAEQTGLFTDNGLDVNIDTFQTGVGPVQELSKGNYDLATSGEFVFVSHITQNPELRIISHIDQAEAIELIARKDANISSPEDLNQKRIGVTAKSQGEFFLGRFLLELGMTFDDIEVEYLLPSQIVESMKDGSIDAAMIWEPNIYLIKQALGDSVESWSGQSGQNFYFLLTTRQDVLDEKHEAIVRFVESLKEAQDFLENNPEQSEEILANRTQYTTAYLDYAMVKSSFQIGLEQALLLALEDEMRWLIEQKIILKNSVNFLEKIDTSVLEEVKPDSIFLIQ